MPENLGNIVWTLCYAAVLIGLSLYGLHRYVIVYLYLKNKKNVPVPASKFEQLPRITVQLPMFKFSTTRSTKPGISPRNG